MSDKKEMAFPIEAQFIPKYNAEGTLIEGSTGMTLRDYMAAQFLCGFCSDSDIIYERTDRYGIKTEYFEQYAELSYRMADAMLKARGND